MKELEIEQENLFRASRQLSFVEEQQKDERTIETQRQDEPDLENIKSDLSSGDDDSEAENKVEEEKSIPKEAIKEAVLYQKQAEDEEDYENL